MGIMCKPIGKVKGIMRKVDNDLLEVKQVRRLMKDKRKVE